MKKKHIKNNIGKLYKFDKIIYSASAYFLDLNTSPASFVNIDQSVFGGSVAILVDIIPLTNILSMIINEEARGNKHYNDHCIREDIEDYIKEKKAKHMLVFMKGEKKLYTPLFYNPRTDSIFNIIKLIDDSNKS